MMKTDLIRLKKNKKIKKCKTPQITMLEKKKKKKLTNK